MPDDVLLAKAAIVENCLRRIREVYADKPEHLFNDWTRQDSILLNLGRCCQAAIDAALRVVRLRQLGLPQESREAFVLMAKAGLLPEDLARSLQAMVGFRNIAIHNYRELDLRVVQSILEREAEDLQRFARLILTL